VKNRGICVALPGRKKLVAIAVGILLGGLPLVGFDLWLATLMTRQSLDDIEISARRSMDIAEARLDQAGSSLDILEVRGVDGCDPHQVEKLREVAFAWPPVKELAVVDSHGGILCSSVDTSSGQRVLVRAAAGTPPLEIWHIGVNRYLRLLRPLANGNVLSAMMPIDLLMPLTASQGGPFAAWVGITTQDGAEIAEGGPPFPYGASKDDLLTAMVRSTRYDLQVKTAMPKPNMRGNALWLVGAAVNGAAVVGAFLLIWLISWRRAGHPLAEIERALAANEFEPYFQPIVDITSARLLGAEVLVRWRKSDGTVISPAAFIPLLEQSGLIIAMTQKLMRRVCEEVGPAYAARPHLSVSFNVTAQHFAREALVAEVKGIFSNAPVRFSQVVLELTERQPPANLTATRRVIAALQGLGCRIALDDVGTGHNGLSSILKLGVDIIKIDKLFIDSLGNEQNSAAIIETLVDLARNMRMHVIAEGVEDFNQVGELRSRGISAAQGFLFAPPLPTSSFLALLESIDPIGGPVVDQDEMPILRLVG
jgi:sensor c-di-GMP phosphodiesterase-like protein